MEGQQCGLKQKRIEEFEKTHKLLYELMSSYLGEGSYFHYKLYNRH